MSTAPRPHTKPSTTSAAERVAAPAVGVHRDDVGVAHEHERRRVGIGALDLRHQALAAGLRLVDLVVARAREVAGEQIDAAGLRARRDRAVVHALVADEQLEEIGDLGGGIVGIGITPTTLDALARAARSSANASSMPPATVSRSRPRRAVADQPEVEVPAVRQDRDVEREVP